MIESSFRFLNYRVTKIEMNIDDNFGKTPDGLKPIINSSFGISEENPKLAEIILDININSDSSLFAFFVQVKGVFEANDEMTEDMFIKMCKVNAPAVLLPYARSIITNYTALCNIKPIILPLFNLTKNN